MRFARSGGSPEHDVQPLAEVVSGVEACDHAPVEPALLHQVDGPQVRLGIAQSRAFDQALDPGVHVTGVRAVDGEPDHLSVAQWHGGLFVEAFERVEQVRGVHLAQLAFGLGVDDHRVSPAHVRVAVAAAHPTGTVIPAVGAVIAGVVGDLARDIPAGFEDRPDMRVAGRGDRPQRQRARVLQPLRGIPFRQAQHRQRGVHRLFVETFHGEQFAYDGGAVGSGPVRPPLASFPIPRPPHGFAGKVGPVRRILVGGRRRQEPVRAEPGVFVPDLERVRPDPQVHGGADVRVRDGIPVARIGDVAVGLNPPAVHPVHHLVCHRRQRDQQRLLLAFERRQT